MVHFRALFDANIFYSVTLSDLIMESARAGLFRAFWSERIHLEWTTHLKANRPDLDPFRIDRRKTAMNAAVDDAVVSGFDHLILSLQLPDPDDRHVLAAAITAGATSIVTKDLKDFPAEALGHHGIVALHPDAFLMDVLASDPDGLLNSIANVLARMKNPQIGFHEYRSRLAKAGLPQLAGTLAGYTLSPSE